MNNHMFLLHQHINQHLDQLTFKLQLYEGEDLNYNMAYHKVREVNQLEMMVAAKSFELLIPFLEEWKDVNPGSTVDWNVDHENSVEHLFICSHYTEHVLQHLWPVISMNAAHLKSCYKGTIYIYSGWTGTEDSYILAFGIRRGNEDFVSWDIFNTSFAQACLCVTIVEEGNIYLGYVFVSMNAAHLKSCYKGTIYIYSGWTGTEDSYILAFGIRGGNEDFVSWDIFNTSFAQACLCVTIVEEGNIYLGYVFVSMNAAHLKSCYKGTIYLYSGWTGTEDSYILAFGIRRGNEDFVSWDIFNTSFAQACLCVTIVEEGNIYLEYVVVSD